MSETQAVIIKDRGEPLELHRELINGVEVYTTTEEKEAELKRRYDRLVPKGKGSHRGSCGKKDSE